MKKMSKRITSILLVLIMLVSALCFSTVTFNAVTGSLTYEFSGVNSQDRGYAEGTMTLSASDGTYWLYWADDNGALEGYSELAKLTVSGSATHSMYAQTAIPVSATKVIAIESTSEPTDKSINDDTIVCDIPASKQWGVSENDKNYRFASYSDIHMDYAGSAYAYDDEHWAAALDTAAKRDVDFIITSGDGVNNNEGFGDIYIKEWQTYSKILADSDYCNPIYEAIGNHEIWQGVENGTQAFINATGLSGSDNTSTKAYFAKDIMDDHFIFMSLEGGFYPNLVEEFSDEQLDWLEGLLKEYSGDGKNIYIVEHSLFYNYGAGDKTDGSPYYDIPLGDNLQSTQRFKALLQEYKDTIFVSGHTHISFDAQLNYSTNNDTSAQMVHNSSVGGIRKVVDDALDRNYLLDESEGYIVDVYDDAIIFNGANLYYNEYNANCCYIVNTSQQAYESMTSTDPTTATTTAATTYSIAETTDQTSMYYLKGSFNSWGTSDPLYFTTESNVFQKTIYLSPGTYTFKINYNSSWYGNSGTIQDTTKKTSNGGWVMSTSEGDCTLVASGGYYTFNYNNSNSKLNVFYSTTDPTVTEPPETTPSETESTASSETESSSSSENNSTPGEDTYTLGDVNEDGRISIKDATLIQMYLIGMVDSLTNAQLTAADVNADSNVNIEDVTLIQKYLAKLVSEFGAQAKSTVYSAGADADILTTVKDNLDLYYRYSSYDCYQALKKEYYSVSEGTVTDENTATLTSLLNDLLSVVDTDNVDSESNTITLYFENNMNWSTVNAYCWGSKTNASWPGVSCTYVGTNASNGNKIYSYTLDKTAYKYIIFNDGSTQTIDTVIADGGICYYLDTLSNGKYKMGRYKIKDATIN